jgi:hypothetical protein
MAQIVSSLIDQPHVDAIAQDRLMMYHDTYDGWFTKKNCSS